MVSLKDKRTRSGRLANGAARRSEECDSTAEYRKAVDGPRPGRGRARDRQLALSRCEPIGHDQRVIAFQTAIGILCCIKGSIGQAQKFVEISPRTRTHRIADARRYADIVPFNRIGAGNFRSQTLREGSRFLGVAGALNNREFIASEPGRDVAGPERIVSRVATTLSKPSPMGWPNMSFTGLNLLRSRQCTVMRA